MNPRLHRQGEGAVPLRQQMVIGRGQVDHAGPGHFLFIGFLYPQRPAGVQIPRQVFAGIGSPVLHHEDRRGKIGRKPGQNRVEDLPAAGGRPKGHRPKPVHAFPPSGRSR